MAFLAIRRLKYSGRNYAFESPMLKDGMNLVVGENGSGKSTFSNLIYFGLGGHVEEFRASSDHKHVEIVNDSDNFVELLITIDEKPIVLKRLIGSNDIHVSCDDELVSYPLVRGEGRKRIFSDWLLERLGITPVVLQYGAHTGKLNFTDLARLIYHDQAPDPSGVFKSVDRASFVSDSRVFRRAIFEILIGKSFLDYYEKLAQFRDSERELLETKRELEMFKEMASGSQLAGEDLNLVFIDKRLTELIDQRRRLESYRKDLARIVPKKDIKTDLANLQDRLITLQLQLADVQKDERALMEEQANLQELKSKTVLEATQVRKMMFTNDELQLFDADTCPYCLTHVKRSPHLCICGKNIGEQEYEKFFYNSSDYETILKTKQKNVETLSGAIASGEEELNDLRARKASLRSLSNELTESISRIVSESDVHLDIAKFEEIENTLSSVQSEIGVLEQQRELEERRDKLEKNLRRIENRTAGLRLKVNQLESAAELDIKDRVETFSAKYNDLMRDTIKDCRSAYLDSDYMPILNGGEYKEASANVPKRLLYYGTMLYMSLAASDVAFPRFLLIDTPETAGIDTEVLKTAVRHLTEVIENSAVRCQVIMTTGYDRYPEELESQVFLRLRKIEGERLLQRLPDVSSDFVENN